MNTVLGILATLVIIFIVPIIVYSLFVKFWQLKEPEKKLSFLVSVLVQKIGTAIGFVVLFALSHQYFSDDWLLYGLIWAGMFAIVEIGQALGPDYSKKEAVAGIISEFIYFPVSAWVVALLLS